LEYTIRKVRKNKEGLVLSGTNELSDCTDNVNLLDGNMNIIKRYTEALLGATKKVCLEVNKEKIWGVLCYCLV
jgi:hypothetical protein